MVWALRGDVGRLEKALNNLRENPKGRTTQLEFWAATCAVCHTALTVAKFYPVLFDEEVALKLEKLFQDGIIILDNTELINPKLIREVQQRYNKLKPYIEKEKQSASSLTSKWPVLDSGKPFDRTFSREEIYGDDGR